MKNIFKTIAFLSFFASFVFGSFSNVFLMVALTSAILSLIFNVAESNQQKKKESQKKQKAQADSQHEIKIMNQLTKDFFSKNESYPLGRGIYLVGSSQNTFDTLDVMLNGEVICKMGEFNKFNHETYEAMRIQFKKGVGGSVVTNTNYIQKEEKPVSSTKKSELEVVIEKIQQANDRIPNQEITDGLNRTKTMLESINLMVKKTPSKEGKLDRINSFYLPSLLTILENYDYLCTTNKDDPAIPTVEKKLISTLALMNEALASIRDSMNDAEIIDINADMSVIESMLQQDGLVKKGSIDELK